MNYIFLKFDLCAKYYFFYEAEYCSPENWHDVMCELINKSAGSVI